MTREYKAEDLFDLVTEFTAPTTDQDSGQTVPSLWTMLLESTARAGGNGGSSIARSRPPVSTAALSIIEKVRATCLTTLMARGCRPMFVPVMVDNGCQCVPPWSTCMYGVRAHLQRNTPGELRRINSILSPHPNSRVAWAEMLDGWIHEARSALGLVDGRIQLPRGTRCLDCSAAWVKVRQDGETIRKPALVLVWNKNGSIHYVACLSCGSSRWPADLHALAEHQRRVNLEQETMADPPRPTEVVANSQSVT